MSAESAPQINIIPPPSVISVISILDRHTHTFTFLTFCILFAFLHFCIFVSITSHPYRFMPLLPHTYSGKTIIVLFVWKDRDGTRWTLHFVCYFCYFCCLLHLHILHTLFMVPVPFPLTPPHSHLSFSLSLFPPLLLTSHITHTCLPSCTCLPAHLPSLTMHCHHATTCLYLVTFHSIHSLGMCFLQGRHV